MPRARNIKPSFFTNEELVELPIEDRLLFVGLWTMADRAGRMEDRPKRIKITLFPADNLDVNESLERLQQAGFIERYQVDSCKYIQICKFEKHQNPHKNEADSCIPAPDGHGASTVQAREQYCAAHADSLIPDSLIPESSNSKSEKKPTRFTPPTLDDVAAYCKERGNTINAQRFIDFYESKGWMVGTSKMKNWKAAVRTWEGKQQEQEPVRKRRML